MFNYFLDAFRENYVNFSGRARRAEYWSFVLFFYISLFVLALMGESFGGINFITGIFYIASLLPFLALTVRRLHDSGKSGWWLLIGIIPLLGGIVIFIFTLLDSDPFENEWGQNPKEVNEYLESDEDEITSIGEDL